MGQWLWQATKFAGRLAKFAVSTPAALSVWLGMAAEGSGLCCSAWPAGGHHKGPQEVPVTPWSHSTQQGQSCVTNWEGSF